MPSDTTLQQVLSGEPPPNRLGLHAALVRFLSTQAGALSNYLREPLWWNRAAEVECEVEGALGEDDWLEVIGRILLSSGSDAERLVHAAAVLQALDACHRRRHVLVAGQIVEHRGLSGPGQKTLFLPPPKNPIAARVSPDRKLPRGPGELGNNLRSVLDLHWHVVPQESRSLQIRFDQLAAHVSKELGRRLRDSKDLLIGLASPFADLTPQVNGDPSRCHRTDGTPYRFVTAGDLAQARPALEEILALCTRERIDVLLFPELTLDTDLFRHLKTLLRANNRDRHPELVVAGSFHVDGGDGWVNRCRVLDARGEILLQHDKCTRFKILPEEARLMDAALLTYLGIDQRGGYEDIDVATSMPILDCDLGRLATPICLDFCGDELRELLIDTATNLLFVPAMTPTMRRFHDQARELGDQNRATTFVVNSAWLLKSLNLPPKKVGEARALAYVPARTGLSTAGRFITDSLQVFSIRELVR